MRQSLHSFLDDCAARAAEPAFAHWRGLRVAHWSYGRLAATAYQFARELEARGIGKSERVLIRAANSPEWVAAFFGCLLRGAVVVPLDVQSAPDFAARVQQQVAAKLLLSDDDAAQLQVPQLRLPELSAIVARHSSAPYPAARLNPSDLVEIIFTSGTTAEPKGVCLTEQNFLANLTPLEEEIKKYLHWERLVHPLRFLNLLPLSHIFGQFMGVFVPQLLGGVVYFPSSLNPAELIAAAKRERISVLVAFPRLLETLREKIERDYAARNQLAQLQQKLERAEGRHPLRRLWTFRRVHRQFGWKFWAFICGGATLDPESEDFWRRLGFAVIQGYGMTETASIISIPHPFKLQRGSIGKPLPGQEVKLGERGEILVRGANVSPGYWSGATQALVNHDGWLHTGDVGEQDAEGNIYFRGREKDVIVTAAGLNIYPDDLEAALDHQPEIRESAVIGIEGAGGPEPLGVLIVRSADADVEAAVKRANATLAQHQQIRRWFIWTESDFPRTTTTRKVLKRLVAETVKRELAGQAPARASTLAELAARFSGQAVAPLTSELKLDSLGRVELLSALEDRYHVELDEAAVTAATTVSDLEKLIHAGASSATAYPYPRWPLRFPVTWLRALVYHLLILPLTWLLCWLRVKGREKLRAVSGPTLFVSNHVTQLDAALLLAALPWRLRRRVAIAMRGEYLRDWRYPAAGLNWFERLRWRAQYFLVATFFNVFPLPQESGFRRSFAFAGELMDRGYSVLLFPEGRLTTDGRMNPLMAGTGMLAARLNAPVVPLKLAGLFELKEQGRRFARPGQVSVTIGEPIRFGSDETPAEITRALTERLAEL